MNLNQVVELLNSKVITNNYNPDKNIQKGIASDLMSDVLTIDVADSLLMTGLSNLQTIRTAQMAEIGVIVIARNKIVAKEMIELAEENHIILLECRYSLFKSAGILYGNGLESVY
ncbi:hypothetical protein [Flavobacterium sp.]|jgi:hypothetical protein|uniref:hypothetical protein n=1 Tax=Flavobacterium sp. TaxID=239 RepID=UPI0037C176A0